MDLNPNTCEGSKEQPKLLSRAELKQQTYRQHLDMVVDDVAGRLEKKAQQIRIFAGMTPKDITQEQFDATVALICNMR